METYEKIWNEFANKWKFNDGQYGVVNTYILCKSGENYFLLKWVRDMRYNTSKRAKCIYKTNSIQDIHKYLEINNPK